MLFAIGNVFCQQETSLVGKVTDFSGEQLEFVTVAAQTSKNKIGTITNARGNYELKLDPNKDYEIEFSSIGYKKQTFKIRLKQGEKRRLNCVLEAIAYTLPTFEVQNESRRNSGIVRLDPNKIMSITGPGSGVESMLKTLPDVSSNNEMSSQYSVRGGNFDENVVYINDIEVYRPFLVRAGQQEGLSIINPDLVGNILFSPGGFEARYGDKISSVLDITYRKPTQFRGSISASLLGGSAYIEGVIKNHLSYNIGFRRHSNQYILKSLPVKGVYRPVFTDLQMYLNYKTSNKLDISFLGIYSDNQYKIVPETRTTDFGNIFEMLRLKVYFDGQEVDHFRNFNGAVAMKYLPNEDLQLQLIGSMFTSSEQELYDIQGQYWLYEIQSTSVNSKEEDLFDRGIGTYLEHARNFLYANIFALEFKGDYFQSMGPLSWGIKYQHEYIDDKINEWKLVDSADYSIPNPWQKPGDISEPSIPLLQNRVKANHTLSSNRAMGYVQKSWDLYQKENRFTIMAGLRGQYWDLNEEFLISPRASVSYKPKWKRDMLFRLSTGVYSQSPFYREYRDKTGELHLDIKAQKSYQIILSNDFIFKMWNRPFMLVSEVYYKYISDLIPYEIDNMRIRYSAKNNAVGYATGASVRLNGEFIEGIESWASMSVMQTQEDIEDDAYGYIARPTDQRFMFKIFFQDYIPRMEWWRMNLSFIYGSGLPFTKPNQTDFSVINRLPSYMRVDFGTSIQLKSTLSKWAANNVFKHLHNIWLHFEIFNLFDNKNTVSYIWISDYDNKSYAVPNHLTARQLNVKLVIDF